MNRWWIAVYFTFWKLLGNLSSEFSALEEIDAVLFMSTKTTQKSTTVCGGNEHEITLKRNNNQLIFNIGWTQESIAWDDRDTTDLFVESN